MLKCTERKAVNGHLCFIHLVTINQRVLYLFVCLFVFVYLFNQSVLMNTCFGPIAQLSRRRKRARKIMSIPNKSVQFCSWHLGHDVFGRVYVCVSWLGNLNNLVSGSKLPDSRCICDLVTTLLHQTLHPLNLISYTLVKSHD